ncbi:MAG: hypothetical protein MPF33_00875 [Candidatus Aramenus sp.]|jgi:hypothetical protein|nr:hypothetical protein [Candidatus Aramenus sp.]
MLTDKALSDAKFYNKPIALLFYTEDCDVCKPLFEKVKELSISKRFYLFEVDAIERSDYFIRLTRGLVPSIVVVSPEVKLLGIVESNDVNFVDKSLRRIYERYSQGYKGEEIPSFSPEPDDPSLDVLYEVLNRAMSGETVDFRGAEFVKLVSTVHKEYQKALKTLNPENELAKFVVTGERPPLDAKYVFTTAFLVSYGLLEPKELYRFFGERGLVYRSERKEGYGYLVDQSMAGNALITLYNRTGDSEYLKRAEEVFSFVKQNLSTEKGFRDVIIRDKVTSSLFLEPLANAEASLFFARLWAVTENEEAKKLVEVAMRCAFAGSRDIKVLSRIALTMVVLNEKVKTSEKVAEPDYRVYLGHTSCKFEFNGTCFNSLEEIKPKVF